MKILLICGSLRRGSFNGLLEQKAAELLAPYAETEILHYGDLPLFNADEIYPFGKEADHVRKAIAQADGLWFFSLEYNGSFTGVLKNLLDYASMTYINGDYSSGTPLKGKPVTISAAAGKMAAAGSVAHLSTLLKTLGCSSWKNPRCASPCLPKPSLPGSGSPQPNRLTCCASRPKPLFSLSERQKQNRLTEQVIQIQKTFQTPGSVYSESGVFFPTLSVSETLLSRRRQSGQAEKRPKEPEHARMNTV